MRKVTEQIATAFKRGESRKIGNTETDGFSVWLHGNQIARYIGERGEAVQVTLAGWGTVTTRERLNGILQTLGLNHRFHQVNHEQMLDGEPVDAHEWLTSNLK